MGSDLFAKPGDCMFLLQNNAIIWRAYCLGRSQAFMSYQLNSSKAVYAVCLCGGDFNYFWTLLRHVRRFLYHYLRFYFRKPEFEWIWTVFKVRLILNLPVILFPTRMWHNILYTYKLHKFYMLEERNHFLDFLFCMFFFLLTNIRLDALAGTCLRILLCSETKYCREYLCTKELEVF